MRARSLLMLAALCGATSAHATPLPTGETELHIEAQGAVKATSATMVNTLPITKRGKEYCEKEVADKIAGLKAQLAIAGLPASALTIAAEHCVELPKGNFGVDGFDPEAMVMPKALPTTDPAELARREETKRRAALPLFRSNIAVTLQIEDLNKMAMASMALNMPFGVGPNGKREFHYANPGDVNRLAYADALAKARAEADTIAHELGAHVVRIARVSNHGAPVALGEAVSFFANMAQQPNQNFPAALAGTHTVAIAVDYVISPN